MRLASLDFLLFFFPAVVLIGICLPKNWRTLWCGAAGFIYCLLQGLSAFLPMILSVFVVRLLLLHINEASSARRKESTMIAGFFFLVCMVLLVRFWHGAVPIAMTLCLMQLVELLLMYYHHPQPMLPFGVYFGYCFGLMRLWAGPVLTVAQYEYISENCKCTLTRFGRGVGRFIRGFAKLVLLALPANAIAETLLQRAEAKTLSLPDALIGLMIIFFAVRYSLGGMAQMGSGVGTMLGYLYPEPLQTLPAAPTYRKYWEQHWTSAAQWAKRVFHMYMPSLRRGVRMLAFGVTVGLLFGRGWNSLLWSLLLSLFLWAEPKLQQLFGDLGIRFPVALQRAIVVCMMLLSISTLYPASFGSAVDFGLALVGANGFRLHTEVLYALKINWLSLLGSAFLLLPIRQWLKRCAAHSRILNWLSVLLAPLSECLLLILCMGTLLS